MDTGIDLTVLICSTHTRWDNFGQSIQKQIWPQYQSLSAEDQSRVEIIMLTDNKKLMLGDKRNVMVDIAQGRYVVFVDDDDRIEPDYLSTLLEAIGASPGVDVITFYASVTLNGGPAKICRYSTGWDCDHNTADEYHRLPNHICCVKRELARKVSYPSILYGEDSGYSKLLAPLLTTERAINRVLYHYDFSEATTETQTREATVIRRREQPPLVDIVFLSNAKTDEMREMAQHAVDTCVAGANALPVNVTVVEQQPGVGYDNAQTIYQPGPFRYNAFANLGIDQGSAEWVAVANSDLVFTNGWLHALLAADYPFVSPKEPSDYRQQGITENTVGDVTGAHLSGWFFMMRRELWERIGGFDECVDFWCSDDVVIEQCRALGILPMLVPGSTVKHLGSKTFQTEDRSKFDDMTWAQIKKFSDKYGPHRFTHERSYKEWLERQ